MTRLFPILLLAIGLQVASPEPVHARKAEQSATDVAPKNAYKAVFSIVTYDAADKMLGSGYGFFIDKSGTGVAAFSLFEKAARAEVFDYAGRKLPVTRILGAQSTYDIVKFQVEGAKGIESFDLPQGVTASTGTPLLLRTYTTDKKSAPTATRITQAAPYGDYKYYHIAAANEPQNVGCPLFDEDGAVIGIVQRNVGDSAAEACAIDARFVSTLSVTASSAFNADLRAIRIPKALPATADDALTYIYMLGTADSLEAAAALADFIAAYPERAEGYLQRATFRAGHKDYAGSEQDFQQALNLASTEGSALKPDEVHNELSKTIFQKLVYAPLPLVDGWDLPRAYAEATAAYELNPSPNYLLQQGRCLFAQQEYGQAYDKFRAICATEAFRSEWSGTAQAEVWHYAAQALERAGGDSLEVIALMDSTIAALPTPLTAATAEYLLLRAQRLTKAGEYRKAVLDYNAYEATIGPKNLNAYFYFVREQVEMKAHMYQQALDDIRTAIAMSPADPTYRIEEAVVLVNVGMFKEVIAVCEQTLHTLPENPDCYKLMGIAHGELGQKAQARQALQKAKDLGDPTIDAYLEKYQ